MSRVVSKPDYRDDIADPSQTIASYNHSTIARKTLEIEEEGHTPGSTTLPVVQSPIRIGMASPFRNFLGLLKPPPLPGSSLHDSSDADSPRSIDSAATEIESLRLGSLKLTLSGGFEKDTGAEIEGQRVVMVAFDANVKEISHSGIVWAMEHVLNRGDVLAIVSILDSVRGPLGYRVKIGDHKWMSANQKLVEEEIQQKMEAWRSFPGLDRRCEEGGVKLVVRVRAAQRGELEVCKEAMKLSACHVVLDKSLKNRHRGFYLQNLSCNVTRMRRSGGVDVIRPNFQPRSPTSVIPPPILSYDDQIDEFEIRLRTPKPRRLLITSSTVVSPPLLPSSKYPELLLRRLQPGSAAILATAAHEHSSSSTTTSTHERPSSVSTRGSITSTSSSNAIDHDMDADADDDLFSIFHGSTRHAEIDIDFGIPTSGYESDDLFSIGNASTRRTSPPRATTTTTLEQKLRHSHHHHHSSSIPDTTIAIRTAPSSSCELVISEPLRQATISRITFVVGLGESVALTLRSPLRPGEGLLVGSSPAALFLMHADRHQSATLSTDLHPSATLSTATPSSYIAMEGKMAMKLSFLEPEQRVLAVDSLGRCRSIRVERAATQKKPLVLVEAHCEGRRHGVLLQHSESVGLRHSHSQSWGGEQPGRMVSVKGLKVGDRVLLQFRSTQPSHAIWSS